MKCHEAGFVEAELLAAIDRLNVQGFCGFMYGSGFEAQPQLITKIAERIPLLGNAEQKVRDCKTAKTFFTALAEMEILYPEVRYQLTTHNSDTYLIKHAAGCGGGHVRFARTEDVLEQNWYFQRHITGDSISLLFLANGQDVAAIGYHKQWTLDADNFSYGGSVSCTHLSEKVKQKLVEVAKKLTCRWSLLGLNSLDTIVKDEQVYVLEINPRLSASIALYADDMHDLMSRHVQICKQLSSAYPWHHERKKTNAKAHAVVTFSCDVAITEQQIWPEWVTDTPIVKQKTVIPAGIPICSVLAEAGDATLARQLAEKRCEEVKTLLRLSHKEVA